MRFKAHLHAARLRDKGALEIAMLTREASIQAHTPEGAPPHVWPNGMHARKGGGGNSMVSRTI